MGGIISAIKSVFDDFAGGGEHRILLIGLDAAGKTTLLYKMKIGEVVHTVPTIGFNVEEIKYKNLTMCVWDVGGQHTIRALWRYYYQGSSAIIFMVDSADAERFEEARETLASVLADDTLRGAHLLVFANKQDLPGAASVAEIADNLGISKSYGRRWHVQACSALSGDGVVEGFDWLSQALKNKN